MAVGTQKYRIHEWQVIIGVIIIIAWIAQPEGDKHYGCWYTVNVILKIFGKNAQWWHYCYAF